MNLWHCLPQLPTWNPTDSEKLSSQRCWTASLLGLGVAVCCLQLGPTMTAKRRNMRTVGRSHASTSPSCYIKTSPIAFSLPSLVGRWLSHRHFAAQGRLRCLCTARCCSFLLRLRTGLTWESLPWSCRPFQRQNGSCVVSDLMTSTSSYDFNNLQDLTESFGADRPAPENPNSCPVPGVPCSCPCF